MEIMINRGYIKEFISLFTLILTLSLGSCVKNDIPYPYKELYVLNVEGDGFNSVNISTKISEPTVVIDLEETTDIRNVNITTFEYSPEANISRDMVGTFDLRSSITTSLYLYQQYDWVISATQTIERYVNMRGLLGSEIDAETLTAKMYVNDQLDATQLEITDIKLAAAVDDLSYSPSYETLTSGTIDFSNGSVKYVDVTAHGRTERWTLSVELREATVELEVGAWARMAWLYAEGDMSETDQCYFYYREEGATTWIEVTPSKISGAEMEGVVSGLTPSTKYEFKASAGGVESEPQILTTDTESPLPNGSFDEWYVNKSIWYPYSSASEEWWSSGNDGSMSVGSSYGKNTTTPLYEDDLSGENAAYLHSENVVVKFAAGNIFTGSYGALSQGMNAYIKLGRPFTSRPIALRGRVKYKPGSGVDNSSYPQLSIGDVDKGFIYCALGEWTADEFGWSAYNNTSVGTMVGDEISPVVIETYSESGNTTAKYSVEFDKSSHAVIAYGEKSLDDYSTEEENAEWEDFEISLDYLDSSDGTHGKVRTPTHIIIVCSSSKYGDYFIGSSDSEMWLDDLELLYE